ncbi:hypothetical protein [Algibacter sp. 2305UL17-15]|uniref:hypothetical protein n=1 Tax=Algibacter sp. 2305UL17-15 TaxID=3231268 RepID=UPI00345B235E
MKKLRLLILFAFFFSIGSYAQTDSYLKDERSPESTEDIVKLLNLKNAKRITVFLQKENIKKYVGEITLYENGRCMEKQHSIHGHNMFHKYDSNGKLIEYKFFTQNNLDFRHYEYVYNKHGNSIVSISKDELGAIIKRDTIIDLIPVTPQIPRYKGDSDNYTYSSDGFLIKYLDKGFFRYSSKSLEDHEGFKNNKLEYNFKYNRHNQIIKYHKKLETTGTLTEVITEFNYINDNIVKVKSNKKGKIPVCCDELLYEIEYY